LIGRLRIYFRTGLKGELVLVIGGIIFILGNIINSDLLIICGFLIANIGLIILVTIELGTRREIFRQVSFFDKLIGNVPTLDRVKIPEIKKEFSISTGIFCLLISGILFSNMDNYDINKIVILGTLVFAGVFFIIFGIVKKNKNKNIGN
jgi:hypothetical protein